MSTGVKLHLYGPPVTASKKKKHVAMYVAIFTAAAVMACCWLFFIKADENSSPYASGTTLISADGMQATDYQAYVNKLAEKSMMTTAIPSPMTVDGNRLFAEKRTGNGNETTAIPVIQNPAENTRDMRISLSVSKDDGSEELIYQTDGLIKPGSGYEDVRIAKVLKPGEYDAKALFEGYDPKTHAPAGSRIWNVKIIVL